MNKTEYNRVHQWLKRHYTKTGQCDTCNRQAKTQWANKTGKYNCNDRDDWLELCPPCHYQYDIAIHSQVKKGRPKMTPYNLPPGMVYELRRTGVIYGDTLENLKKRNRTYPWYLEV